jgi:hypothetical protein
LEHLTLISPIVSPFCPDPLQVLHSMRALGCKPDAATYNALITGAIDTGAMNTVNEVRVLLAWVGVVLGVRGVWACAWVCARVVFRVSTSRACV